MHLIFLHCEMGHSKVLKDLPKKSFKLSVFAEVIILKLLIFLILIIGPFRLFNFFQEIFVNLYFSTIIHFNEIFKLFFYYNYLITFFICITLFYSFSHSYFCLLACSVTSVVSDTMQFHGLQLTRLFCLRDYSSKDTRVGCHFLLQGSS